MDLIGSVLIGDDLSHHPPIILLRKEPLRNVNVQVNIQGDGGEQCGQRKSREPKYGGQGPSIKPYHRN